MRRLGSAARFGAMLALACAALVGPSHAVSQQAPTQQWVTGVVVEGGTTTPVPGAMVVLVQDGRSVAQGLSGSNGSYRVPAPRPGRFQLRIDRIGYESTYSEPFDVAQGATVERRVESRVQAVSLAGISVEGARRCEVRPEGRATALLWEEARKALEAAAWTQERGMYRFAWTRYQRELSADARRVLSQEQTVRRELGPQPFRSISPELLARDGFIRDLGDSLVYAAPDAEVLLSDAFLDTHCFTIDQRQQGGEQLIGLRFEPLEGRRLPDVEGVLWLGRQTLRLRSVEYRYVNLPWRLDRHSAGGEVYFRGLPNGTWIVNEWTIRMLKVTETRNEFNQVMRHEVRGYTTEGSVVNVVATTDGVVVDRETGLGSVRGVVADSAGRPVANARVWIQGTDYQVTSDRSGRFELAQIAAGVWSVGASYAPLDAVGHGGTFVDADVERGATRELRLSLPSVRAAAVSLCAGGASDDTSVLVGRVVDENGRPVPGASVRALWTEGRVQEGIGVDSDENGRFAVCGLPTSLRVRTWATLAQRESRVVELSARRGTGVANVEMELDAPPSAIPGVVVGATGPTTEGVWLASKGFPLRAARALLHQTQADFRGRGLESLRRILMQIPRVEAKRLVTGRIEYRLHALGSWTENPGASVSCPLEFYLNGNLVEAHYPTLLNEYGVPGAVPGDEFGPLDLDRWLQPQWVTGVEVFDADDVPVTVPGGCGAALFWVYRLDDEEDPDFTGALRGQVMRVPENVPVEGVVVTVQPGGLEQRTDRFGRFDFGWLPAARYRIDVVVPDWGPLSSDVMLRAGSNADVAVQVQPKPPTPPGPAPAGSPTPPPQSP